MTPTQILVEYGWLIALTVAVGVISWSVLILQALFHDKRIGLIGVFGSLLVAFIAVFPELTSVAGILKSLAAMLCVIFMLWFLLKNHNKATVYLPVIGVVFSLGMGYWLYQMYQSAG